MDFNFVNLYIICVLVIIVYFIVYFILLKIKQRYNLLIIFAAFKLLLRSFVDDCKLIIKDLIFCIVEIVSFFKKENEKVWFKKDWVVVITIVILIIMIGVFFFKYVVNLFSSRIIIFTDLFNIKALTVAERILELKKKTC